MNTRTLEAPTMSAPALFKALATLTFGLGVAMHTTRLIIGVDNVVRYVMTPAADIAFGGIVLAAAIPGILSWRRYSGGRLGRALYAFMMFMLVVSVPLHLATI